MGDLLFSPTGRIGPADYFKGVVVLAIANFLVTFSVMLGPIAMVGGLLSFVFFYCFIALGIKRSHDAGKSGWMVLVHIVIAFVIAMIFGIIVSMVTGVSASGAFMAALNQDLEALEEIQAATTTISYILVSGLASAVGLVVTGFVVNLMHKSDGHDNQYGPMSSVEDAFS